ncbi:hypothetical protein WICANDRAFT_29464 [Wickerhamomyces anomalus NRRL Y-366-8]|uniref:50S ribosomal protein L35 n=1 Tax=Wickerhamomyces anomalus (strain ATCC 58044 / CBS 1984 / NCYC 433 / NRRL Y-366-8) TaxID=683960 RepID=A0A1E3P5I5_WICAA|nr:uncharacterized protein WICANDRAFT_29464 [Wickerhamomyces anomalus NRRL Y-366-8]ODQ60540.1 hypothetical protein WICANDRAFT_29464 [Wickerhamomyces anomalus NRRL Y-366-8]
MFALLNSLVRPVFNAAKVSSITLQQPSSILVRGLMKTHKGAAKRWRKTASGYKRAKAGKNHGNAGWSKQYLKGLGGKTANDKTHTKRLKRLLPYH